MTNAQEAIAMEARDRAVNGFSAANEATVIEKFHARGIPVADIKPRENVFTYKVWLRIFDRQVEPGSKAVKIPTYIPVGVERDQSGKITKRGWVVPRTASVFHISQTRPCK